MEATTHLPANVHSPAAARRFCEECLQSWRCAPGTTPVADLLVSELVTNVITHAGSGTRLTLRLERGTLRIEVADEGDDRIARERTRGDEPGGWGIPIVEALAPRWGVEAGPDGQGKVVWVELDAVADDARPSSELASV